MSMQIIVSCASAIIALLALLFSVFSFKRQQDRANAYARASVKPLLSIKSQNFVDLKSIRIMNYGVGPAIIRKAEFQQGPDGSPTDNIVSLFDLNIVWESFVNVPPNRAIPAEGEILLIQESLAHLRGQGHDETAAFAILAKWRTQKTGIRVHIEYEDIYGNPMTPLDDVLN